MASGPASRWVAAVMVGRWVRAVDVVVTVALAGSSIVAIGLGDPSWGSVLPVALVLALCSTVPVAWRSSSPVGAATVVVLADAGCAFAAAPRQSAFQPFVALALVAYSVGSRAEGRAATWAPPALLALLSGLSVGIWASAGQSSGNLLPSVLWLAAAWVVGRIVRSLRYKNDELARAYDELSRQRELQAEAAVAIERGRIARELHDIVAHNVSMMVVQAGAADRVLGDGPSEVRAALEAIAWTGRQTVDEMRTLLGVLRQEDTPVALRPQPGLAELVNLLEGVRTAGLPVELRLEGERRALPPAMDMSIYRIVQEGLTNALKHAGPAEARVTIRFSSGAVDVEIRDSGRTVPDGAPRANPNTGHGLVGMRERAAMFGGHLVAAAEPTGFTVRASLPLPPPVTST